MRQRALRLGLVLASILVLAMALFLAGVLWPLDEMPGAPPARALLIRDVTVLDVDTGERRPAHSVLVRNGRIEWVRPAGEGADTDADADADAIVVDGRGRYLMPGLWDMHAHVFAISPLLDLPMHLAHGVTGVRDMQGCPKPGDPFIACAGDKRRWTQEALAGQRVGPRILSSASFMANGPTTLARVSGVPDFFGTATAAQARAFVHHQREAGADEIKTYDRIPREAYFALVDEARRLGLPVVGHRPHAVSAVEAAAAGQKSIEHARVFLHEAFAGSAALRAGAERGEWTEDRRTMLDDHDPAMAQAIFDALVVHGVWYVPTHLTRKIDALAYDPPVRQDARLRYVHPLVQWQWLEDLDATVARAPAAADRAAYRDFYLKGLELTGQAHRAGVRVLAGTDSLFAGSDLHEELAELVAAGLTPVDAIRAATLSAAEYYGLEHSHGRIAPGYAADLVLLDADPFQAIGNTRRIRAVVFNGALYDREALERILAHVESRAASWAVACKILWRFIRHPASY